MTLTRCALVVWTMTMLAGLAVACGGGAPSPESAAPAASSASPPSPAPAAAAAKAPETVADLFPPGPGRDLVLNNCTSCHSAACSVIGQRTADRWEALKTSHADRVGSPGDLDTLFNYLKTHFSDAQPEPVDA